MKVKRTNSGIVSQVVINNKKVIDFDDSIIFDKIDDGEAFLYITNKKQDMQIKIQFKKITEHEDIKKKK